MDSIISQIRSLAEAADEAGRHSILDALQLLQSQLETPMDVLMKLYNSHVQTAVIYVAVQLGLFKHLAADPSSTITVAQLADKTGASPQLLRESDLNFLRRAPCRVPLPWVSNFNSSSF